MRSEPSSWTVVGVIPVHDKKKAVRAGRPLQGHKSCARRKTGLLHQCYNAVLQGWDELTSTPKRLLWADGIWRWTQFCFRALLADQPECDTYCCDTSQSCKICTCPKDRLHLPQPGIINYPLKRDYKVQDEVYKAADGVYSNRKPLFERMGTGPFWRPTIDCNKSAYEKTRVKLNGTHIMPNAFWNRAGFDVQQMVCVIL